MDLNYIFIYTDDILFFSRNEEQHKKDLSMVLQRLQDNDLRLVIYESEFFLMEVYFLSYTVRYKAIPKQAGHY